MQNDSLTELEDYPRENRKYYKGECFVKTVQYL